MSTYFKAVFQIFVMILISGLLLSCSQTSTEADLVLRNGKIVTLDEGKAEVRAIAVKDDIIVAIGSEEEIRPM
ncbi:MAG: hypothetical protein V3U73_00960, partial [bacterium]